MKKSIQALGMAAIIATMAACGGNSGEVELTAEEIQANVPSEQSQAELNDPAEQAKFTGSWLVESLNGTPVELTVGTEYIISGMDVRRKTGDQLDDATFTAKAGKLTWAFRGNSLTYNYTFADGKLTLSDAAGASAILLKQ